MTRLQASPLSPGGQSGIYGYEVEGYGIPSRTVQNVTWWDDYRFLGLWGVPVGTDPRVEIIIPAPETTTYGLATGDLAIALGRTGAYSPFWTVHYYDDFGREIQTNAKYLHGVEKETRSFDFTGNVTGRTLTHMDASGEVFLSESYTYGYDSWSRPTTTYHRLGTNGINVCLSSNSYDEIGRITGRQRASSSVLGETLGYNVRSWLDSISVGINGRTFKQVMTYYPLWSGNISSVSWNSNSSGTSTYNYTYDNLSRLKTATYIPSNGGGNVYKSWNYDLHGNILSEGSGITYTLDGNRTTGKTISLVEEIIDPGPLIPDPFVPVIDPEPVIIDTTAQISLDSLQYHPFIPDAFIHDYAYDACGRIVSDTEHSISRITYNVLNLPSRVKSQNFSAPDLYYIYASDGRKLEQGTVHPSTSFGQRETYVPHITYQGNLVYVDGVLDRILFDGGYISAEDNAYHFFVTDHLGSVRVVAKADGTIERCYDYEPYGRDLGSNTGPESPTPNPYKFGRKEYDQQTSHYDFGARLFSPATGRWTTMDPLCEKYYSWSPYAYCAGNPVNMVDPEGKDIYYMGSDGHIGLVLREENEYKDRLYSEGSYDVLTVYNQSILSQLSVERQEGFNYAISPSLEMINVFDYVSRYSNVEWAIGTFRESDNSLSLALIRGRDKEHVDRLSSITNIQEERIVSTIHTHIGFIQDHGASGYHSPTLPGNDRENIIHMYYRMRDKGLNLPLHFVYEVPNNRIYRYTPWKGDIDYGNYSKKNLAKALKVWDYQIKAF